MLTPATSSTQTFRVDQLRVHLFKNRQELGVSAAQAVAGKIRELHQTQEVVHIIFASAPSQNEFLDALAQEADLAWNRIRAFHMDEYMGLPADAPQSFGQYLKRQLFDKVPIQEVFYLDGNAADLRQEGLRYSALLDQYPTDIVCMGIGENCHIAFNDPHVADFNDPHLVKIVRLDLTSRQQQVHDGCFDTLEQVPEYALTLTIPALVRAPYLCCMVPAAHKAEAIYHTLTDAISETYPATILRTHPNATLFIDQNSARKFLEETTSP
ncbi:glucosamine-6-phosphate deaminase [Spirosoma taeanense]|uniref:Glucosamine-6-phosphate deaminase n=1 Tax=Spirosoma taeanense TaxID=2735870 RepID=A0A6M5YE19_9BACT|nr:glucosamine-6-phosphate deaminase [Spirosoma taeanense]QJW91566.1 glucosamine-6-phosphate deaminase [Spirosoma taeanense]